MAQEEPSSISNPHPTFPSSLIFDQLYPLTQANSAFIQSDRQKQYHINGLIEMRFSRECHGSR